MNNWIKISTLLALAGAVSGCSWLFGEDGTFRDRSDDYRKAREEAPLQLPEGIESNAFGDDYSIPRISDRTLLAGEFEVPRPDPLDASVERDVVRINKLGEQQWILVDGAPGQIWPRLRSFFNINQLALTRAEAVTGIMETSWLQPATEGAAKERYRLRIEQGIQRGSSEIYVLQADQQQSPDSWPAQSDNEQRESLMMQELAQFLADNALGGSVSMLAQQAIDSSGRVTLEQEPGAEPYISLQLPFYRAWASLGRAIRGAGFEIDDLNRSERLYYVRFDENARQTAEEEDGWFSGLFGNSGQATAGDAYFVRVKEQGKALVAITIERQNGEPMAVGEAEKLLKLIKRHLS